MHLFFDTEHDELVRALNNGEIDQKQFDKHMRDLRYALQDEASDAGQRAYDEVMSY